MLAKVKRLDSLVWVGEVGGPPKSYRRDGQPARCRPSVQPDETEPGSKKLAVSVIVIASADYHTYCMREVYVNLEEVASWAKDSSGSSEIFALADLEALFTTILRNMSCSKKGSQ